MKCSQLRSSMLNNIRIEFMHSLKGLCAYVLRVESVRTNIIHRDHQSE